MPRQAYHHAASGLVSESAQLVQNGDSVGPHAVQVGMNSLVERPVGRLKPQQVSAGSGLPPESKFVGVSLTESQCNDQRGPLPDFGNDLGKPLRRSPAILTGLEDNRTVSEFDGLVGAGEDFVGVHPVAFEASIVRAQPAVRTPANAVIRELRQPAKVDFVADVPAAHVVRRPPQFGQSAVVGFTQPVVYLIEVHPCCVSCIRWSVTVKVLPASGSLVTVASPP